MVYCKVEKQADAIDPLQQAGWGNTPASTVTSMKCQALALPYNWSVLLKFDGEFANGSQSYAGRAHSVTRGTHVLTVTVAMSLIGRYCCKKIFGPGAKNIFPGLGMNRKY